MSVTPRSSYMLDASAKKGPPKVEARPLTHRAMHPVTHLEGPFFALSIDLRYRCVGILFCGGCRGSRPRRRALEVSPVRLGRRVDRSLRSLGVIVLAIATRATDLVRAMVATRGVVGSWGYFDGGEVGCSGGCPRWKQSRCCPQFICSREMGCGGLYRRGGTLCSSPEHTRAPGSPACAWSRRRGAASGAHAASGSISAPRRFLILLS